jgi:hypothetical protein
MGDKLPTPPTGVPGPAQAKGADVLSDTEHQALPEPAPMPTSMAPGPAKKPEDPPLWERVGIFANARLNVRTASGDVAGHVTVVLSADTETAPIALVVADEEGRRTLVPWHAVRSVAAVEATDG